MTEPTRDSDTIEPPAGGTTHFGNRTVEAVEKEGLVRQVFDRVASRYDLMNDLMSGGLHRLWKDAMVAWLSPPRRRPWSVIDVAGGTGDVAFRVLDRAPGAHVTVLDINQEMLDVGQMRAGKRSGGEAGRVAFLQGDAQTLPFEDASFDAYTIAFGIRNVTRIEDALSEARRVLKPGGRFLCLEFSQVTAPMLDRVYDFYSFNAIPAMGRLVAGDAESYRYLVESIRRFPNQAAFSTMIEQAGLRRVRHRNLSGGIAAMHSAYKF
ncbi:MAG: bifunctional demethylmenaquinone methyltransferase/2-methoxy-6-polyprenyl-1,4-benzoquinol methylase UbiE [Pseudomonadota bacterium]